MTPIIYNINNAVHRERIAAFDFDWTLVCPKDGKTFPSNVDDWQWLYPSVPTIVQTYYNNGFMIVIFTNQSKFWKHQQLESVANALSVPVFIVVATEKTDYKPNPILFTTLVGTQYVDKSASFFVGDALGRPTDFANSDKMFAENIELTCYSPEQVFCQQQQQPPINIPSISLLPVEKQIIIMMGYPGSGKSTIAKHICKTHGFAYIEGDVYKSANKMIKAAQQYVQYNKSIVFDATNGHVKKRREYIDFAQKHAYPVLCIHVATPLEVAYQQNKQRSPDKQVPKIAYSVYKKYFEPPTETEGFTLYTVAL